MSLASALPRSLRGSSTTLGRIGGLVLVGLAVLCCMLGVSSGGVGHHSASSPSMVETVADGEADAIEFTGGAGPHDHGTASCGGDPRLILGSASVYQFVAAGAPASGSVPATEAGEDSAPQSSGTVRSPASVPHLLCVMRT